MNDDTATAEANATNNNTSSAADTTSARATTEEEVGIHARSGWAKIESVNVVHVMNIELHRNYLTSIKRLMSYAQKKRTDVDPSKKIVNL